MDRCSCFHKLGFQSAGFLNLSPKEAYSAALAGAVIVDVRERNLTAYKQFDVPDIIYCSIDRINEDYVHLPKDRDLILADSVGLRSRKAMEFLASKGFTNIANLAGGIVEWEHDAQPLKINNNERLDGSCTCQLRPRIKNKNK